MAFPTDLDSFTDPTASSKRNSPSLAGTVTTIHTTLENIEAKVGVDSSAVTTSHDYKIANPETANNVGVKEKDSGGTARNMVKVNASDQLVIGDSNLGDTLIYTTTRARAYPGTSQLNIANSTPVKVLLDTETYDSGGNFDTINNRFVAPVAGYYLCHGAVGFSSITADRRYLSYIYVNGSAKIASTQQIGASTSTIVIHVSDIIYLNASDYVELYARQESGGTAVDVAGDSTNTYLAVHLLSV